MAEHPADGGDGAAAEAGIQHHQARDESVRSELDERKVQIAVFPAERLRGRKRARAGGERGGVCDDGPVIAEQLPRMRSFFHKPIIANISGFAVEEFVTLAERLSREPQVEIIEVNVSCPNVHGGGMSFGTDPKSVAEVTRSVKQVSARPVFVKLSPNVTDIVAVAKACEEAGADGICLINTLLGMRIDIARRKPVIANKMGGFSGPAVFPGALRMVYQVSKACSIPVMGCGGVASADDVIEMMMAGATAVQVGAANLVNPYACKQIVEDLPKRMESLGIEKLSDIIGIIE